MLCQYLMTEDYLYACGSSFALSHEFRGPLEYAFRRAWMEFDIVYHRSVIVSSHGYGTCIRRTNAHLCDQASNELSHALQDCFMMGSSDWQLINAVSRFDIPEVQKLNWSHWVAMEWQLFRFRYAD